MPIYDYHCHLSPKDIAENRKFNNITELWLEGDHYKWRGMRTHGLRRNTLLVMQRKEKFACMGRNGSIYFRKSALPLDTFRIEKILWYRRIIKSRNCEQIWNHCNELLQQDDYSVKN